MNTNIHELRASEHNMDPAQRTPIIYMDRTGRRLVGTSVNVDIARLMYVAPSNRHKIEDFGTHFILIDKDSNVTQLGPTGRYR